MAPLPTKAVSLACVASVSVWFRIFREAKTEIKIPFSVFLCSETAKKSLLRRLE